MPGLCLMISHSLELGRRNPATRRRNFDVQQTLYEKCGGFSAVSRIVLDLYDRLLDDDDVGPFFDEVEMARVIDHQTKFISSLLGGPASYSDEQIRRMHNHLAIGDEHFARLRAILAETLSDHGLGSDEVASVVDEFEKRRALVVNS